MLDFWSYIRARNFKQNYDSEIAQDDGRAVPKRLQGVKENDQGDHTAQEKAGTIPGGVLHVLEGKALSSGASRQSSDDQIRAEPRRDYARGRIGVRRGRRDLLARHGNVSGGRRSPADN